MFLVSTILVLSLIASGQLSRLRTTPSTRPIISSTTPFPSSSSTPSLPLESLSSTSSPSLVADSAPAEQYLCDSEDKLITNAWSINNLLYLKLLHYQNNSARGIECRIFVYDFIQKKFLNVYHFPSSVQQYADSGLLKDVLAKAISKAHDNNTATSSPSIVYFGTRTSLRSRCQSQWLYVPPSSQFCRFHPIVNYLYRVFAIIDQADSHNIQKQAEVDLYRMVFIRGDEFPMTSVRPIQGTFRNDHKRDVLEQYITNSILTLQVNHQITPPPHQQVRFIFSNNLGLFVSWYPSAFTNFENDLPMNCAIMMPIKYKPYIRVCSRFHNFVSFIELNQTMYVILPENRAVKLEHEYIKKQYRIMNNLYIDLDNFETVNLFQEFFGCPNAPAPIKKSFKDSIQAFFKMADEQQSSRNSNDTNNRQINNLLIRSANSHNKNNS